MPTFVEEIRWLHGSLSRLPQGSLLVKRVETSFGSVDFTHDSEQLFRISLISIKVPIGSGTDLGHELAAAASGLLPVALGTPFQHAVWQELRRIPCGVVRSYGDIARQLGKPQASRAVGSAIGANPLAILIPCHRVLRGDGGIGGYHWGLDAKRALLAAEFAGFSG